jgi:hypothetical protein
VSLSIDSGDSALHAHNSVIPGVHRGVQIAPVGGKSPTRRPRRHDADPLQIRRSSALQFCKHIPLGPIAFKLLAELLPAKICFQIDGLFDNLVLHKILFIISEIQSEIRRTTTERHRELVYTGVLIFERISDQ